MFGYPIISTLGLLLNDLRYLQIVREFLCQRSEGVEQRLHVIFSGLILAVISLPVPADLIQSRQKLIPYP